MASAPNHDPLRALFRKAWDTTAGDVEGARQVFGMFIRMSSQSLHDFHHIIEHYAVNRLVEEMRAADAGKAEAESPKTSGFRDALLSAAAAEEKKEAQIEAMMPSGLDAEGRARIKPLIAYLLDHGDGDLADDLNRLKDVGFVEESAWDDTGLH